MADDEKPQQPQADAIGASHEPGRPTGRRGKKILILLGVFALVGGLVAAAFLLKDRGRAAPQKAADALSAAVADLGGRVALVSAEAKAAARGRLCLEGNIQIADM